MIPFTLNLYRAPTLLGMFILISTIIANMTSAHADGDSIFQCVAQSENYTGRFSLSETGKFRLKARKDKTEFACELRLKEFTYNPKDEVANVTFRMSPTSCRQADGTKYADRSLVKSMSLIVTKGKDGKIAADVQWITYLQTASCKIDIYVRDSVIRNAERFKKGIFN